MGGLSMAVVSVLALLLVAALCPSGADTGRGRGGGVPYDYSATVECLAEPLKPQYGGGIIRNPEFNRDVKGWFASSGGGNVRHARSSSNDSEAGYLTAAARSRNSRRFKGPAQRVFLRKSRLYTLSAWVQAAWVQVHGVAETDVTALVKTSSGSVHNAGHAIARSGCWSMLKGGLTLNDSGPAILYFKTPRFKTNHNASLLLDSVSLQPFTPKEWSSHQQNSISIHHKRPVRIRTINSDGSPLPGAVISLRQSNGGPSPFGCAVSGQVLTNPAYNSWFTSRFTLTTFENEMKWYSTEKLQGHEDYSIADAMMSWADQHGIAVRGHNVLWDDPRYQQPWVNALPSDQLREAAMRRVDSVMNRYRGKVVGWDVVNEDLHFSFFEGKLGGNFSGEVYARAKEIDGGSTMFMNDYNTVEDSTDVLTKPAVYLEKMKGIVAAVGDGGKMAIGVEGHFHTPNLPYMRASLDMLAASGYPIWLTEVDVSEGPNQASYLEMVMREGRSHPGVKGIVVWGAWKPEGCYAMCLTDNNFQNLPTGDVVDRLLKEWSSAPSDSHAEVGSTGDNGVYETRLFHGEFDVKLTHPDANGSTVHETLHVETAMVADSELVEIVIRLE